MKELLRKMVHATGLEVRIRRNLVAAHAEQKRQAQVAPWQLLTRYAPATILDIGANDGYSVRLFRQFMSEATIYSFEPLQDCYEQVAAALAEHPPGRAFQCALGDREETSTIHRNQFTPSSSLLPMGNLHRQEFPHTANSTTEAIRIRRLDDLASQLHVVRPLIAKIDVQGFEDRVIRGGENTLRQAVAIVVELSSYPLYEGQASFAGVHSQLAELGFVFRGTIEQMHSPQDGRILQFDGLFENRELADLGSVQAEMKGVDPD